MNQPTWLVVLEYIVGLAAAYALVRYVVLPAIRKSDNSSSGVGGGAPGPKDPTQIP